MFSIYQLFFYFLFISHSSSYLPVGYPFINYELSIYCYQLSIHQLAPSYFLCYFFYNCLFRILNNYHRINLDSTLVSSSSVDEKDWVVVHPKSQIKTSIFEIWGGLRPMFFHLRKKMRQVYCLD